MRGSRNFCQGGGGGGGGGGGRGPTARKQSGQCFFQSSTYFTINRVDPMVLLQRGGGGPTSSGGVGVSKRTHITCDFPGGGGPDPLTPLWIRTWGRLTPLFAYRIMVYQNLNKTENTTQRRLNGKKLSPADRDSKCGSRGGSGGPDPLGKSQVIWVSIGYKQLDPLRKSWTPPPWKMLDPPWNLEK